MSEEGLLLQESSGMDLEFRGVGASLGGKQILKDVSGVVRSGEMLAIMGASGESMIFFPVNSLSLIRKSFEVNFVCRGVGE